MVVCWKESVTSSCLCVCSHLPVPLSLFACVTCTHMCKDRLLAFAYVCNEHVWSLCPYMCTGIASMCFYLRACVYMCVCARSRASRSMLPKGRGRQPDPGHSMTLHPDLCCDCLNYPSSWQRETERARGSMCVAVNWDGWFLILVSFISCKLMFPQSPLIFLSVHSCSHLLFHRHLNPKHSVLTKPSISTSFHVFHHTGTSSWITNQAKLTFVLPHINLVDIIWLMKNMLENCSSDGALCTPSFSFVWTYKKTYWIKCL